jgi:hypothetical protein
VLFQEGFKNLVLQSGMLHLDKGYDYEEVSALAREFAFPAHIRP